MMGWLRSLFASAKEEEAQEVPLDELHDWFIGQTELMIEETQQAVEKIWDSIQEKIGEINEAVDQLAEARLQNESIPEKARAVMEGNRAAYVKFVRLFLNSLAVPEQKNDNATQMFLSSFESGLDTLQKTIAKNVYVLQEFFAHETADVIRHVKALDVLVRSIADNKMQAMARVKQRMKELESMKQMRETLAAQQEGLGQEGETLTRLIRENEEETKKQKKSPAWREVEELLQEQQRQQHGLKQQEDSIHRTFAPLERVMRKYAWLVPEHKVIIEQYLASPLPALMDDTRFDIVLISQRMGQLVQENQIELKDREKEKIMQRLGEISQERLSQLLAAHHLQKQEVDELDRRIRSNAMLRQMEDLNYKRQHLQEKLRRIEEQQEKLEKQQGKISMEKLKEELEGEIEEAIGVKMRIV